MYKLSFLYMYKLSFEPRHEKICIREFVLLVSVEVLQPCQQLKSCRAGQLPINTVSGQALSYEVVNHYLASTPPIVTDNYR